MAFEIPPVAYPPRAPFGMGPLAWTGQNFVQRPDIPVYPPGSGWGENVYRPPSYPVNPMVYGYHISEMAAPLMVTPDTAPSTPDSKKQRLKDLKELVPGATWESDAWEPNIDWELVCGFEGKGSGSTLSPVGAVLLSSSSLLESNNAFTPAFKFKNLGECNYFLMNVAGFTSPDIGKGWLDQDEVGETISQRGGTFKRRLPARFEIDKAGNSFNVNDIISMERGQAQFSAMDMGSCMPMMEKYYETYPRPWQRGLGDASGLPYLAWQEFQPDNTGAIWFSSDVEGPHNPIEVWVAPCPLILYPIPIIDSSSGAAYLMALCNFSVTKGEMKTQPGGRPPIYRITGGWASFGRWYKVYPTMYPKQHGSDYDENTYGYVVNAEYLNPGGYVIEMIPQKLGELEFQLILCAESGGELGNAGALRIAKQYAQGITWLEKLSI